MRTHTFALLLQRPPTDDQLDVLADVCGDAGFTDLPGGASLAEFDTSSSRDLLLAIADAIDDIRLCGLVVTGIVPVTRVMDQHVADRVGCTQQELMERVRRSEVAHPKPMFDHSGYMDWAEVRAWLGAHRVPCDYDWAVEAAACAYVEFTGVERQLLEPSEMARRFWQAMARVVLS